MRPEPCPNCGVPRPDQALECPACGVVFAKWRMREEAKASAAVVPRVSYAETAEREKSLTRLKWLGVLAPAALIAWYFLVPPGRAVPPGAHVDEKYQFALPIGSDWKITTPDQVRGDFVERLSLDWELPTGHSLAAKLLVGDKPPLAVHPGAEPNDQFKRIVNAVFFPPYDNCDWTYPKRVLVDGVKAVELEGSCARENTQVLDVLIVPSEAEQALRKRWGQAPLPTRVEKQVKSDERRETFVVHMVPGAGRWYLFGAAGEESGFNKYRQRINFQLESLRVLERPNSMKHAKRLAFERFRKQFLVLAVAAVFALYKWILSGLFE